MQKVKIAAVKCHYYIIIINVLGYIEEDFENFTRWLTEERKTSAFLKEKGNVRNIRKSTISYSGNLTHMKLLYKKKKICGYSLHCIEVTYCNAYG